jgi:hypothetical protein
MSDSSNMKSYSGGGDASAAEAAHDTVPPTFGNLLNNLLLAVSPTKRSPSPSTAPLAGGASP